MDDAEDFDLDIGIGKNFTLFLNYPDLENNTIDLTSVGIYEQLDLGAPSFVAREYYLYVDIETAWEIYELGWKESYAFERTYSKIELRFPAINSEETDYYINQIKNIPNLNASIDIYGLAEFEEGIGESLDAIKAFTQIISFIAGLAGAAGIIVAQMTSVAQRTKEFAILKATGWKNKHVFRTVIFESLLIAVIGAVVGFAFGAILVEFFSSNVSPLGAIKAIVTWRLILIDLSFALGVGLLGGLYPGYKATKVRPIEVLKGG
jgi:ABC-type antimicrobial peptide transport system permease subunit